MASVRFGIPPSPEYVGVIRLAIGSLAREAGLDPERAHDLKIAVSEVCTNAVNAALAAGVGQDISITWQGTDATVTVEIEAPVPPEPPVEDSDTSPRLAFSRDLLEALLDSFEVAATPTGVRWVLLSSTDHPPTRRLRRRPGHGKT